MKKILVFSPNQSDACAFYRGIGAFSPLHRHGYLIERAPEKVEWSSIMGGALMFMQRPYHEAHLTIANIAKRQMPLWIDFDDALFDLPADNPSYTMYAKSTTRNNIRKLCTMADKITFTTRKLQELFETECEIDPEKVSIIPNAYNDYLLPRTPPTEARKHAVLWRGSESHQGDLASYAGTIAQVVSQNPEWDFMFMGMMPWMLPQGTKLLFHSGSDLMEYFPSIRNEVKAAIQIIPLNDNPFNHAKSNIAWIEATHAGSAVLAPDWPEWRQDGVNLYTDQDSFFLRLTTMLAAGDEYLSDMALRSWVELERKYLLSQVNKNRLAIIEELT